MSAAGLDFAPAAARRCAITCIHNAPGAFSEALVGMWGQKTAEEAYAKELTTKWGSMVLDA